MTAEEIAEIHHASAGPERPWSASEIAGMLASPGAFALSRPGAFLLGRAIAGEAEVLMLATHPSHRRQGKAAALLAGFDAEARRREATSAFLEVAEDNAPARALYEAAGYTRAGRRPAYYPRPSGAVSALILIKPL
ncbi:GNAT family N-acetyltransferase [Pseudoroseicyclus tamaricis]|uniref:GNAT family N-acetyltransferase n=1 Tax=Pseudoroseicyclus tamaricis TaxID=2705421 RepID=A0A6B2K0Q2_9RHOB|nr:GNAT family N-acetyltransferase [Pseudoroseicyclus tamaricis]NDU99895.1 GNAT family N-acetyltransferase [Pseudoroseicyclus tamaricis]